MLINIATSDKEKLDLKQNNLLSYLEVENKLKISKKEMEEKNKDYLKRKNERGRQKEMEQKNQEKQIFMRILMEKEAEFNQLKTISKKFSSKLELISYFDYIK